jgi:YbbR domain-containing protein
MDGSADSIEALGQRVAQFPVDLPAAVFVVVQPSKVQVMLQGKHIKVVPVKVEDSR